MCFFVCGVLLEGFSGVFVVLCVFCFIVVVFCFMVFFFCVFYGVFFPYSSLLVKNWGDLSIDPLSRLKALQTLFMSSLTRLLKGQKTSVFLLGKNMGKTGEMKPQRVLSPVLHGRSRK